MASVEKHCEETKVTLDQVQQQQRRLYGKDNALRTASGYLMECSTNGNFAATSRCKAHCTASTISNGIGVGLATIAPAEKAMRRQELFARSLQGIATPGEVVRDTGYREGKHGQGRAAGYREGKPLRAAVKSSRYGTRKRQGRAGQLR